jgi:hypothetical protein
VGGELTGVDVLVVVVAREEPVGTRVLPVATDTDDIDRVGDGVGRPAPSADEADTAEKSALSGLEEVDMVPEELPLFIEDPAETPKPAWPPNAAPIVPEENVRGMPEGKA